MKNPSNRSEVEALSKWVDIMVFKIYKDKEIEFHEVFDRLYLIYTSAIKEIFR